MYIDGFRDDLDKLQVSNLLRDVKNQPTDVDSKLRHLELETKFASLVDVGNTISLPHVGFSFHGRRLDYLNSVFLHLLMCVYYFCIY